MDLTTFYNTLLPLAEKSFLGASDVAAIVITGLCVVFCGLIILILFVWAFGKIFSMKNKSAKAAPEPPKAEVQKAAQVKTVPKTAPNSDSNEDEIIAVISAAIAAMSAEDGKTYKLKSVKAADIKPSRSAWALAGRQFNTNPF